MGTMSSGLRISTSSCHSSLRVCPPIHPCGYCGAHEGWMYTAMTMVRKFVFGLLIVFLTAYFAYRIHPQSNTEDLDELEKLILEYKREVENGRKGEGEAVEQKQHLRGLHECVGRNEAGRVDQAYIRRIAQEEISVFDLDKTGKTDFALGAMGGAVVATPNTENYFCETTMAIFLRSATDKHGPESILDPSVHPGDCWAFVGRRGSVVVRLSAKIVVTEVALEHLPREVSPSGDISSAPKIFSVIGMESPASTVVHSYGSFSYSDTGASVQSFPVKNSGPPTQFVRFDFQENHGNPTYTCVYRIRVHGIRS